ncbi:MAG TPA: hypothetical protein VJK03_01170 [Candidatus Nanoarchaeia archaeon]|nr:hypothetical protein [Candidatus Nanoarchaeia archaeon]
MKKKAIEIKKGDIVVMGGEELEVEEVEISDIGKQGTKKVRLVAKKKSGEKIVIIRPDEYPIDKKEKK